MSKPVPLGIHGEAEHRVSFEDTLTHWNAEMPPVYSTPRMIGLMEVAAYNAMKPYCDPGEVTVGTAINIQHRASAGVGAIINAQAELESCEGRFYIFRVRAVATNDSSEPYEIGRGTVSRAFVNLERMNAKLK